MELVFAVVVGVMFACGCYLLLQRTLGQVIIGLALLTNATNILIFISGTLTRGGAPLVADGETSPAAPAADPVPQALILTAIVIGFGVLAFFIALAYRAYRSTGSDDLGHMNTTDRLDSPFGPERHS